MPDYSSKSNKKLKQLIAKTERTLAELELELERRETAAQDEEIDHLDEYMHSAEARFSAIKDFIGYLSKDMRSKRQKKP